ncbi:kinase-like protein [Trichoderma citrinoviride]|uniref:Kinase-like protein n=1 Tax=Trichoderma citrinoviride TaxID=58853 RepID=A0A2T4BKU0_9HYPO|nr:kinase-like protein [Trichoderma citrinoviride]PTB69932.1 kinase-like protein [Trichoderma citrinoviride]
MATAASPTPMAAGPIRRSSQRQQALRELPSRAFLTRSESHQAGAMQARSSAKQYNDDSSEDEIPVPMKLSALTKALLNDGEPEGAQPAERSTSPPQTRRRTSQLNTTTPSVPERGRNLRSSTSQPAEGKTSRTSSPARERGASPVTRKRVVRLSSTSQSLSQIQPSKRRSSSFSRSTQRQSRPPSREESADKRPEPQADINTPAHGNRIVRISTNSSGNRSRVGSTGMSSGRSFDRSGVDRSAIEVDDYEPDRVPETVARNEAPLASYGSISRYSSARGRLEENANLQSSMRVKRVGKIPGTFLSGPARRGRRRQSEDDAEEEGEMDRYDANRDQENHQMGDTPEVAFYPDGIRDYNSGSPVSASASARALHRRHQSSMSSRPDSGHAQEEEEEIPYRKSILRPQVPSAHDQENNGRASYKRPRSSIDDRMDKAPQRPLSTDPAPAPVFARPSSPERRPLAPVANNTPKRAAPPPPPKMSSVLEAATSTTGAAAAATSTRQRRNVLRVNGKTYTRLDCLGRGGSAKVYRVTAENGQMFALKRVALENADELTIRGYKGEIDLLGRLEGVDRVINLYAYEMNTEKQVLSLVMEMGERDLNTLLASRQGPESSRFDSVFVRFYWKEMLECLHAVHQHDIVHSDLKPANFVLVKGRLKLIDFGIANAIQTDETVNVHRETQVGTPNYMSPESLLDSNNPRGGRIPGRPKLMKLGKSSDVWSLGCILYQMVYGLPPFGHIANQMARCQAIINWDHHIEFPSRGMGGAPVPPSLIRTLRRCLNRDHHMRPTCEELLSYSDPFLYPVER